MKYNKTRAIKTAKRESLILFSRREYEQEIIQSLNIDISKPFDLYEEIAKSNLTISLYDIIEWFNEQYNLIREKSKDLPDLIFPVYKWEKDKEEDVQLILTDISHGSISFRDLRESLVHEYMRRRYSVYRECNSFKYIIDIDGFAHYETEEFDPEKKELLQEYYAIAQEFYNYMQAYSLFRSTDTEYFKSTFFSKGDLGSAIFGLNPFNNLEQFFVHYGAGGNEDGYFFNYRLGEKNLPIPDIRFWDNYPELCTENVSEILNNPHVLAKTLRLKKSNLPFSIK